VIVQAEPGTELFNFLRGAACIAPPGDAQALAEAMGRRAPDTAALKDRRRRLSAMLSSRTVLPELHRVLTS